MAPVASIPSQAVCLRICITECIPVAHAAGGFGGHDNAGAFPVSEFQLFTIGTAISLRLLYVRSV